MRSVCRLVDLIGRCWKNLSHFFGLQENDVRFVDYPHAGQRRPYRVGDIGWRQMRIVLLGHPRVGMPELCAMTPMGTPFIASELA